MPKTNPSVGRHALLRLFAKIWHLLVIASGVFLQWSQVIWHRLAYAARSCFVRRQSRLLTGFIIALLSFGVVFLHVQPTVHADKTLNFQARLLTSSGGIVPDGAYNVEFKLYDQASGGTELWTETREFDTDPSGLHVEVRAGYLSVYLGDKTPFPSSIDWNDQLYLTMNIGGTTAVPNYDGEMTPRIRLTAVPFAMQADRANEATQITDRQGSGIGMLAFDALTTDRDILLPNASGTVALLQGAQTFTNTITFSGSGTGLSVTNNASIGGTLTVGGDATYNGNLTVSAGNTFTNASSTLFTALSISNRASGGSIGTAATTVDVATTFNINQTTAGQTLSLPSPTNTTSGRIVYVNNVGTETFTMYGSPITAGSSSSFIWNGSTWVQTISFTSTGVESIGTIDSQAKSADGAVISGTALFLQTADDTHPGLVSIGTQAFAGDKTFNDNVTVAGTTTLSGTLTVESAATFESTLQVQDTLTVTTGGIDVTGASSIDGDVSVTGGAVFTAGADSTAIFQIQNATGTTLFNADTTNMRIGIGTDTPAYTLDVVTADAITARFSGRVIGADAVEQDEFVTLGQAQGLFAAGGDFFVQGGNEFGETAVLGTTDTFGLELRTNNVARLTVAAGGDISIANALAVGGTLNVTGAATLSSTLSVGDTLTVTAGGIDVTGDSDIDGSLRVDTDTLFVDAVNDRVQIGSDDAIDARLSVTGGADQTQLLIRANATQSLSNPLVLLQDSTGGELARLNATASSLYLGYEAGGSTASGENNIGIGASALGAVSTGTANTTLGSGALASVSIGSNNTAVGYNAGNLLTGSNNILLGYEAGGNLTSGSNNIIIGYNLGASSATASDELRIGGIIQGNLDTLELTLNGDVSVAGELTIDNGVVVTAGGIDVTGDAVFTAGTDSTTAFQIQNAIGTTLFNADTTNMRAGIGTDAPAYTLDVVTADAVSARFSGRVIGADADAADEFVTLGQAQGLFAADGDFFVQDGNAFGEAAVLGTTDTFDLQFIADNSTRMVITAGGNVGIGTSGTPSELLSVGGTTGNFTVTNGGAVTAVGVDAGAGLLQGTGGLDIAGATDLDGDVTITGETSITGATTINTTGSAITTIGNTNALLTLQASELALNTGTISRSAAGTLTIDLEDAADTTLALTNSGVGVANLTLDGSLTVGGTGSFGDTVTITTGGIDVTGDSSIDGALSGLTGLTSSGAITFSGLGAGVVQANASGVLSSSDLNLQTGPITDVLQLANGGTGASDSQGAINNISQLTAEGDLLYFDGTNSTRLARGNIGECLASTATSIEWLACSAGVTLQVVYENSTQPQIVLDDTRGGLLIRDADIPIGGTLFAVQNFAGDVDYLRVTTAGTTITGDLTLAEGSDRTLQLASRTTNAAGNSLTVSAGSAGAGASAFAGGNVIIQGGDAAGTGNANGGNILLNGGLGTGTGSRGQVIISTPSYETITNADCAVDCAIGQAHIDSQGAIIVRATTEGVRITLPDPTILTAGRVVYITAANGSLDFELVLNDGESSEVSVAMQQNSTATLIWGGDDWTAAGASSSTTLQAAYNSTLTSAGGADIVLNNTPTSAGLTIRNNAENPIIGTIFETQTSIGSNLFSVNNNAREFATNGGAETSGATSESFPANTWGATPDGGSVSRYNTLDQNIATGRGSVLVDTSATAGQGAANRLSDALTPNLRYTVSYTVRGDVGFETLDTFYSPDGTNTGLVECDTNRTVTVGAWRRIICRFDAPASGITADNAVFIRQSDAVDRTFYIDNLSVTISADINHAADGSVENAGAFTDNWEAAPAGGTVSRDQNVLFNTSASVRVDTTATVGQGIQNNLSIVPQTETQYLVTLYARSDTTFEDIRVRYSPDGGSSFVSCVDYNTRSVSTETWTRITCLFTTGATTATNGVLIIDQPTAVERTFWVDALSVTLNSDTASNVQIGGGSFGGPTTLLTLDRSAGPPVADNNDAYLGSMYYDTTTGRIQCYESGGWGTCGSPPDNIVNLNPEYAGSVLNGDGIGTMTADFCANETGVLDVNASLCDEGQALNYYRWTSPQATEQTYSIYVTYQLPSTFDGFSNDDTVQLTARRDNSNAEVSYEMFRSQGGEITRCGVGETVVTTSDNEWQTAGINGNEATGCGFTAASANSYVIFKINLKASVNANAYTSTLSFTTTGR